MEGWGGREKTGCGLFQEEGVVAGSLLGEWEDKIQTEPAASFGKRGHW